MRVGVVVFPGSNCDRDALHAARLAGAESELLWHETPDLGGADLVVLPGGFAYGDYLRAGVLARFSPIMGAVRDHAARGGLVLGICNGFQVLAEAGLVPGALLRNASLRFEHRWVRLSVERRDTPFTSAIPAGRELRLPVAHGEGNYFLPDHELDVLEARDRVLFRYAPPEGNPNGSARDIAGVLDAGGRVCGLMPHPERAAEAILGSDDGLLVFRSLVESAAAATSARAAAVVA
ncbi:MAG: phosphoribosylformylglycinamidine synthase I, phosphoribosylformylglycinamidine synthase [Chloroflexi bacterium CSP1-4]|nr:MAG: phosphoribosylformylglycinamidine synthase I, phosphoribosylformylglycinamidine synthase [Chloroflexi bacterium CSP1-4]